MISAAPLLVLAGVVTPPQDTGATISRGPVAYTIEARLDEAAHVLRAGERIEYRHVGGTEPSRLYLHLYPNAFRDARTAFAREHSRLPWAINPLEWIPWGSRRGFMTIRSVRLGGRTAAFTVDETILEIPLPRPLGPDDTLSIEIAFEVKLPWLQRVVGFRGTNYAMGLWFPKLAVPDTAGWRGEGRPTEADFYADVGAYDVRITAPSEVVVAATGRLTDTSDQGDGTTRRRWRAEQVRYFAWVADRRYRVKRVTWGDVTVEYLHVGGDERSIERGWETVGAALDFYSARYGPYPHGTLVIAETPALGSGVGGVAYSQLIMIPAGMRSFPLSSLYEGVLAHEIAHQWWGMTVGVRSPVDDWLNEGFAEFAARDLERDRQARGATRRRGKGTTTVRKAGYVNQASFGFDRRTLQPDSGFDDLGAREVAVYAKGSFVLDMLQYLVGRDTLDSILRSYAARFRHRNASTPDFVAVAESVSGRDLTWFFDEWLDDTATCDYSVEGVAATAQPGAGYRSVITVRRNGRIVMPVEVEVTLEDGTVLRRAWAGREPSHDIVIASAPRVRRVALDPDGRLLETRRFNNFYPRRVRSSVLPRVAEEDAYHIVHLPFAFYDDGVQLGLFLAGGRAPRLIPPTWVEPEHLTVVAPGYNLATRTATLRLAYSSSLGLLGKGRRAFWGVSFKRDRRREQAAVSARALFGPHFYRAPFHVLSVSLEHQRRFEATPEFDQGTVNSVELAYSLRGLVTDFYPIHGGVVTVAGEGGWEGLGSDWAFLRAAVSAGAYHRVLGGTKLALNVFAGSIVAGAAPRQKLLWLSREANFRAGQFDTVAGRRLTAVNGELRIPVGTGTLLGVAGFVNLAKYWGSGPEAAGGLRREVGVGLRVFDNANYGVQLDVPFWTYDGGGIQTLDFTRLSLRVGRPFRAPGS